MDYVLIKVDNIGSNTYRLLMEELEKLGIKWWSGILASSRDFDSIRNTCLNLGYNSIACRIDSSELVLCKYQQIDSIVCDSLYQFIDSVLFCRSKKPTTIPKPKPNSSIWNTKCRKCGHDAYDSGFSYECSKGCF